MPSPGQAGEPPAALGDIAARTEAARLVTYWAAGMKDRSERCDLEAGMAKFASEVTRVGALRRTARAPRVTVERHYRDTPLMIIGEGTNEIQRTIIARQLVERYGERLGALTSRDGEPEERRQLVLAVRQFVDKSVVPGSPPRAAALPEAIVRELGALGLLGAVVTSPAVSVSTAPRDAPGELRGWTRWPRGPSPGARVERFAPRRAPHPAARPHAGDACHGVLGGTARRAPEWR
jgi:hypothetical protein